MKISEQSLHYRWLNVVRGDYQMKYYRPKSLCSYFWTLVFYGFIVPIVGISALIGILSLILLVIFLTAIKYPANFSMGISVIGVVLLLVYMLWKINVAADKKPYVYRQPKVKQPNLLVEFLKARKNKVCPLIEYVD